MTLSGTWNSGQPFSFELDSTLTFVTDWFDPGALVTLTLVEAGVLPGDTNGDTLVNFGDLAPFVLALTDVPAYEVMHPGLYPSSCDTNIDGLCNFGDLAPFVTILTGGSGDSVGSGAVPEPGGLAICFAGLVTLLAFPYRRCRAESGRCK